MKTLLFYTFPNRGRCLAISTGGNENTDNAINTKSKKHFVLLHCYIIRRPNLGVATTSKEVATTNNEVVTKRLLHQQVKIPG